MFWSVCARAPLQTAFGSMMLLASMVGCVPDMQGATPPCPTPETVPYLAAPDGLISGQVAESASQFESLLGEWTVDILCDPDWGGASPGMLAIQPAPLADLKVVDTPRQDCGKGNVQWTGGIVLHGPALAGLDGAAGIIHGTDPSFCRAEFDPSYDMRLSAVWIEVFLDGKAPLAKLEFALKSMTSSEGVTTLAGHECIVQRHQP